MRIACILLGALVPAWLAGCTAAPDPNSLDFDPLEESNRVAHENNKQIDKAIFQPVARTYGKIPAPMRKGVTNLRYNWKLPGQAIQSVLQMRGTQTAETVTRFMINTSLGLGGLLDPAAEMGLPYRETNFDETFEVWGVPEGGYLELPIGGPGTQRDWTGWALDILLDPVYLVAPATATNALFGIGTLDIVNDRYEIDPVLDELLYNSADSYTAQRISYLQNMRARLQGGTDVGQLEDVYADY
ncbi:VacJ family lipoprotein [Amaricoccus sp.]|uniref:MlaA family lipoprotein n=1 Tax=Amaricoccus sp. TaxID=1872485 RepID=UPI001DE63E67|nr:VacJ family lipoprotein [Amaricoccus sp.]MCC0066509.1 VacJ family lipoprotein [Rhodovulum sp.]HRW15529.1 VacJ family lipoprotein [Amaricoccus sp.]